ncbi:unnamed protein product [Chrysoparadoxa australica]
MRVSVPVEKRFLGLGKTIYNSGVTELTLHQGRIHWETLLTERLDKKKNSGAWPFLALDLLGVKEKRYYAIAENRDITSPVFYENLMQSHSLFYEKVKAKGLENCLKEYNVNLKEVGHHEAHAYSAIAQMPFPAGFILVMDGGGSRIGESDFIEHTTLFYFDGVQCLELEKEWLVYEAHEGFELKLAEGIGSFYERCAQFIFNDNLCSGKVMGLAGYGRSWYDKNLSLVENQKKMDWNKSFKGHSKKEWQESEHLKYWQDLAATVQDAFEVNLKRWVEKIQNLKGNHRNNLILTGGCALNCTANDKLEKKKIFDEIYIPSNPGDEGISLGLAYREAFLSKKMAFLPKPYQHQTSAYGRIHDFSKENVAKVFHSFELKLLDNWEPVVNLLQEGQVVAWIQGRSECGPRALGHRSILARPDREGLKDFLNAEIKFRESFRPYGASVLWEEAHKYFEVEEGYQNPFMSFATPIREEFHDKLKEVSHIDLTCRMQTVMDTQNPEYYQLIKSCHIAGMLPILLNTSLNIMGQPILESIEDALAFFEQTNVTKMVIGETLISK